MLRTLFSPTILAGALAGSAMAQAPDAGCALPSEPKGIPAAIDAAISGRADKDRITESCSNGTIIVIIMNLWTFRFCINTHQEHSEQVRLIRVVITTGEEKID